MRTRHLPSNSLVRVRPSCPLSSGFAGERVRVRGPSVESILHRGISTNPVFTAASEGPPHPNPLPPKRAGEGTGIANGRCRTHRSKSPGADAARLTNASRRRGVSLIELMVVIAIISALFSMVGVVFHRLFLSEQVAMRAALTERTVSRLADQFRRDVHAATDSLRFVSADDGPASSLILMSSQGMTVASAPVTVSYSIRESELLRELAVDGKTVNREVYRLPECQLWLPVSTNEGEVEMVSLIIQRQGSTITPQPQSARPWRSLVIEAALGRDDRITTAHATKSPAPVKEESK